MFFFSVFWCTANFSSAIAQESDAPPRPTKSPFSDWDKNADGFLSKSEFPKRFGDELFQRVDADRDGRISRKEDDAYRARSSRRAKAMGKSRGQRALPDSIELQRDLIYASAGKRELPLDLYRPKDSPTPTPLVIWIHGGGWKGGSKNGLGPARVLLDRGYAVASVEYRLSGEAIFPAAVEDCKAAVSFLRSNAPRFNVDPNRFGVWGSSAGGHLAAMIGTTGDTDFFESHKVAMDTPSSVQAVCDWFGPTDFSRMNDDKGSIDHDAPGSPESRFLGQPIQTVPELVRKANPITYISADDPPFLIMHGSADSMVPLSQSDLLHSALKKSNVASRLIAVENGTHGLGGAKETQSELAKRAADFFDSILRTEK